MSEYGFPSNSTEALAMLYVKLQATAGHSPKELLQLYHDAVEEISTEHNARYARQYEEI